ncbi:MAG: oligosaccharide flippase family protein [Longimicrobiales bacterium]
MSPAGALAGRTLTRHTVYNVLGQGLPLVVALAAVPALLRGAGEARFGVLGLVWMLSTLLGEVGFARAGTRFVADALGAGHQGAVADIMRTILRAQMATGLALGALLAAATPWLVDGVFGVPEAMRGEAVVSFLLLAAATPVLAVGAAFRGLLEAAHRFAALNLVRFTGNALGFAAPLVALGAGWGLVGMVALVLTARGAMTVAFAVAGRGIGTPAPGAAAPADGAAPPSARAVLAFGGWAAVSTVVSPVLVSLDRFVLGAVAGVAAVGVYTAPYEAATRVLLLPGALAATLFPAMSALEGMGDRGRLRALSWRATGAVAALVGPVALVFAVGAHPLLRLWLGEAFTPAAAVALQLLAPGLLANALAQVPFTLLQGMGRADVPARFHLVELPLHAALTWILVTRWGVAGAAAAWTLRAAADAALLFAAAALLLRREARA